MKIPLEVTEQEAKDEDHISSWIGAVSKNLRDISIWWHHVETSVQDSEDGWIPQEDKRHLGRLAVMVRMEREKLNETLREIRRRRKVL